MTRKSILLGTTALAGAALIAAPAFAGNTQSGGNYAITLGGTFGFNTMWYSQDVSTGRGRGYAFEIDDAEVYVDAAATADNGIKYGVSIELNAAGDDTIATNEVWAFIDSDQWGRVEMGNQDDATDRMFINAEAVMAGRVGWDGNLFQVVNTGTGGGITDSYASTTDDATKLIYFTPRFAGFQLGAALTPDAGTNGRAGADNDGNANNVWGLGANWEGTFGDVGVAVAATYETGSRPNASGAGSAATEDPKAVTVGAKVNFAGFSVAAGYADFYDTGVTTAAAATGTDGGKWWDVGVGYKTGPWALSIAYLKTAKGNPTGISDTEWAVVSAGVTYSMAPGWDIQGEVNRFNGDNINATAVPVDNNGTVVILTNNFTF